MKNVRIIMKVLIGLIGATLVYSGFIWAFAPNANFMQYDIQVGTVAGMNMIKSDIGGPLMMTGIISILYAIKEDFWFYPALLLGSSFLVVRVISFIVDGPAQIIVVGIIMELLYVVLVVALRRINLRLGENK